MSTYTLRTAAATSPDDLAPADPARRSTLASALARATAVTAGPVTAPVLALSSEQLSAVFAPRQLALLVDPLRRRD